MCLDGWFRARNSWTAATSGLCSTDPASATGTAVKTPATSVEYFQDHGGFEVIVATTWRLAGSVVIRVSAPVEDFLDCGGHPVIAATARRRSGTEANLSIEGQDGREVCFSE